MAVKTIGKTKVNIETEGCFYCGTSYAEGWTVVKVVEVRILGTVIPLQISACARCIKSHHPQNLLLTN
jgi:hypothetical protein